VRYENFIYIGWAPVLGFTRLVGLSFMTNCHTVEETKDHRSDHYPIEITLDLSPKKLPPTQPPYDYNKTNWDLVKIELQCILLHPLTQTTPRHKTLITTLYLLL